MTDLFLAAILLFQGFTLFATSTLGRHLMATQDTINALVAQLGKAKDEILTKIADLNMQVQDAGVADKVDLSELTAAVQAIDDINPDTPAAPTADNPPF